MGERRWGLRGWIVGRGTDGNLSCRMGWEGMGGMLSSGGGGAAGLDGKGWEGGWVGVGE